MLRLEEVLPAIEIVLAGADGRKEKARLLADPIRVAGNYRAGYEVIGLIDVESDRTNAFGELDRTVLEGCARILVSFWE